jgi:hypothetical protein
MAPVKDGDLWKDPALGQFYVLEPMVSATTRRRYRVKGTTVEFEYDGAPHNQYHDGVTGQASNAAAIRARLGPLSTGLAALAEFHAKGNLPDKPNVSADGPTLQNEYQQLLHQGIYPRAQTVYDDVLHGKPWTLSNLGQPFHLTELEELAMWAYSQPNKNTQYVGDTVNPTYMFSHPRWGDHGDGWAALTSALGKMPTLDQLGLGAIPLYRVERADSNLMFRLTTNPEEETYIYHGLQTNTDPQVHHWPGPNDASWSAEIGRQPHYASASIAISSHSWQRKVYKEGVIKFFCPSAQYINAWGGMGLLDGGEVLIPPGTITHYDGVPIRERWMGETVTMYVLTEVTGLRKKGVPLIDDYSGEAVK